MKAREKECSGIAAPPAQAIAGDDARVMAALEEYLAALEAGQRIDRQEFLARHASIADQLACCLESLEFVQLAAPQLHQSDSPHAPIGRTDVEASRAERLGDFRILRPVGRGGMGVVYEAEQLSLSRRVALKVLPFAATMDPRHLQRFQNEARAAAALHHTNIVPVYAIGSERGVHYYAMQFIDGRTLAAVIAELRRLASHPRQAAKIEEAATTPYVSSVGAPAAPGEETAGAAAAGISTLTTPTGQELFRSVAQLGVQAAEALDHAHQLGVVHRDIKPGNLLLDERGNIWITDFGLAHVRSDTRLTLTGDVVGTLRYMSPEQALAQRMVTDHRTDIYSLGVTLYELLTLRPAIAGDNRAEILKKIAFEEPIPPRRLNKAIPLELETIVLKAMAKNSAERYATAKGLADDLRCFLEDRPIQARRPSLLRRLRKWTRRHRATTTSVAACLLVTLAALAGSIGWNMRDRAARQTAVEGKAKQAMEKVEAWQEQGKYADALAAAKRAEGLLAVEGSTEFRQRVQEQRKDLEMVLRLEKLRLETTADHCESDQGYREAFRELGVDVDVLEPEIAAERIRARSIRTELATGLDTWAVIRLHMAKGRNSGKRLLVLAGLVDTDAWRNRFRDAVLRRDTSVFKELAVSEAIRIQPSSSLTLLGDLLTESGAWQEALALLRCVQRYRPNDVWINHNLSLLCMNQQRSLDEALRFATAAVALRPDNPLTHTNLGTALLLKGRSEEAIAEFHEAIRLKKELPWPHNGLGNALKNKGRRDEAIAEYRQAIQLRMDYAEAHMNLAVALEAKGRLDEAIAEYREAIGRKKNYALAYYNLGNALNDKGRFDEAIAAYREAIRANKYFAEARINLGQTLLQEGRFRQAVDVFRRGHKLGSPDSRWAGPLAQWLRDAERLAELDTRLPALMEGQEQAKDAGERLFLARLCQLRHKKLYAAAARWYGEAFAAKPSLGENWASGNHYNAACAAALAGCGQGRDAADLMESQRARLRRQALDWLRADLEVFRRLLAMGPAKARPAVLKRLEHWQTDADLAGIRGTEALGKLPEMERTEWKRLWQEVKKLHQRAAAPPKTLAPTRSNDGS